MNNTQQHTTTVRKALSIAAEAFAARSLVMRHDWYRFPWTLGPEIEPCLIGPAYLGNVVVGVTEAGMYTFESQPGVWEDVHPHYPDFLVDAVIEARAGKPFPLPRRGNR
ncbi:hypothetical protein [Nocardiopsis sp. NPDC057823]|uniref:hypothetical protein n=1 Tax=Nocardiopsis sp. NPDC057823 TaxID=3346256 RepID=UPI00366CC65D